MRIDAAPINPSDLGLLLANADWTSAKVSGPPDRPTVTAAFSANAVQAMAARSIFRCPSAMRARAS